MAKQSKTDWLIGQTTAQTLTTSFAADTNAAKSNVAGYDQGMVVIYYIPKTGQTNRTASVRLDFAWDGGTIWVPLTKGSDAAPATAQIVTTLYANVFDLPGATGGVTYTARVPIALGDTGRTPDTSVKNPVIRAMVTEDGSANWGTIQVFITLSGDVN